MIIAALTGGIAAGKSTIARRFAELGARVLDADALAREAVVPGSAGLAAIAQEFGADVVDERGELRRSALAERVFDNPEALAALNGIVHPEVQRLFAEGVEAARAEGVRVLVYDVPLIEAARRGSTRFDAIVVAHAPAPVRLERLVSLRGMSPEAAEARIAAQPSDAERLELADLIISTDGPLERTLAEADRAWEHLTELASASPEALATATAAIDVIDAGDTHPAAHAPAADLDEEHS